MSTDTYYKIKKNKRDYMGDRYFRFNPMAEKVLQICVRAGLEKKGRPNMCGIYLIHRLTFIANYLHFYAKPCTKVEFDKQFETVVKLLKNP